MSIDLTDNYFALFEQPIAFNVDEGRLTTDYHRLQTHLHPDRFATAPAAERRWSLQAISAVNDAYETLRRPLARAVYLLSLQGIAVDEETDTRMDAEFLLEQMELREELEAVAAASDPYAALAAIRRRIRAFEQTEQAAFQQAHEAGNWQDARKAVRQWQFLDRLRKEVLRIEEQLDDKL